jgi:hypothetical protein
MNAAPIIFLALAALFTPSGFSAEPTPGFPDRGGSGGFGVAGPQCEQFREILEHTNLEPREPDALASAQMPEGVRGEDFPDDLDIAVVGDRHDDDRQIARDALCPKRSLARRAAPEPGRWRSQSRILPSWSCGI